MPVVNEVKNKLKCKFGSIKTFFACFFFTSEVSGVLTDIPKLCRETCACLCCARDVKGLNIFRWCLHFYIW